jgi:hypothetical protein
MSEARPGFDPATADFYCCTREETRLEEGSFELEEARTRELIQRFAPPPPATVLDVGGAAGADPNPRQRSTLLRWLSCWRPNRQWSAPAPIS